jgi:hypothetical protein
MDRTEKTILIIGAIVIALLIGLFICSLVFSAEVDTNSTITNTNTVINTINMMF